MDLIDLSRKALRKPFHHTNFFVLFVTVFIVLIIGLTILSAAGLVMGGSKNSINVASQRKFPANFLRTNKLFIN